MYYFLCNAGREIPVVLGSRERQTHSCGCAVGLRCWHLPQRQSMSSDLTYLYLYCYNSVSSFSLCVSYFRMFWSQPLHRCAVLCCVEGTDSTQSSLSRRTRDDGFHSDEGNERREQRTGFFHSNRFTSTIGDRLIHFVHQYRDYILMRVWTLFVVCDGVDGQGEWVGLFTQNSHTRRSHGSGRYAGGDWCWTNNIPQRGLSVHPNIRTNTHALPPSPCRHVTLVF